IKLQEFIKRNVKYGDKNQLMYRIDHGKIKPSKNLADQLLSMLKGNQEFTLIDDQKVVFETAIRMARTCSGEKKKVLVVEGGPGTGKSVVAINLLVALTGHEFVAKYVTRNSAPRLVYEAKLTGSLKRTHISNLFSSSGSFHSISPDSFDCLIVDEAHRLNEKSGMFNHLGENQVKEIIAASKLSIFFVDEDQKVTLKDIGGKDEIRRWAKKLRADVTETSLESQFRCNGSDGYLAWLDNTLQIRETANEKLDTKEYDFRIMRNPAELHALIREKNRAKNKARLVAGYCWDWISKKDSSLKDIVIGDYKATWNLQSHGQAWIIKPDSVNEIGCIHTCQGLELDYVGVIIGPDLIVRDDIVNTQPEKRASTDRSIHGWRRLARENPELAKSRLDAIIKNTYRTLMTRGQKGCYVYFVDDETRDFFADNVITTPDSKQVYKATSPQPGPVKEETILPFRRLSQDEAKPFENCVPLYDLEAAAGPFGDEQIASDTEWVQISDVFRPRPDLFVIQVKGKSMNRRIPDGSWCLFKKSPGGTRQGTVVLAQHREISDSDNGGHFTVKIYDSKKVYHDDGTWRHESIILHPDTTEDGYQPIVLEESQADDLKIIGEFVAVLGSQFPN
ncbi:MAG: DUF2075 domain-containing protein, partial [Deltaproteobacteria bacterium]